MPNQYSVGDKIYVPSSFFGDMGAPYAIIERDVLAVQNRSVTVEYKGKRKRVGTKLVHSSVSTIIFRIGDYGSEHTSLNPLSKSFLQYLRLLLEDPLIRLYEIRTKTEFDTIWKTEHGGFSNVVLIGHGNESKGLRFGNDWVSVDDLVSSFNLPGVSAKNVFSLCCKTGKGAFARPVSSADFCKCLVAPMNTCPVAAASDFVQSLFTFHFLVGKGIKASFNNAKKAAIPGPNFRYWQNGKLS